MYIFGVNLVRYYHICTSSKYFSKEPMRRLDSVERLRGYRFALRVDGVTIGFGIGLVRYRCPVVTVS
ncbi:hypothetical protein L1887_20211 [Cichorium endivia]|nr:hypothetical protein L1887_20211 [Cichorium endivia]